MTRGRRLCAALVVALAAAGTAIAGSTAPLATAARSAAPAECAGLPVCVPVEGPWVKLPAQARGPAQQVEWELACPARYVVGGTDARAAVNTVRVSIEGLTGSPVGPGVTTKSAVVFVGSYAGSQAAPTSFRPAIGCVPGGGGGGRPSQVSYAATFPPFTGLDVRKEEALVARGSTANVTVSCQSGGRLLHAAQALGFATAQPPSAAVLARVVSTQRVDGSTFTVTARAARSLPFGVDVTLQVRTVCTQGFQ